MKKIWKDTCGSDSKRIEAFSHIKCLNPQTKDQFLLMGKRMASMLYYVSKIQDINEAIPSMCCGAANTRVKFQQKLEDICSSTGTKGSGKYLVDMVWNMMSDALDMMCGSFSSIEDCNQKKPGMINKIELETEKVMATGQLNSSVVIPFVRIIKRMNKHLTVQ